MSFEKDSLIRVSLLALCGAAASTMNCAPSRGRSMAMTLLSLALVGIFRKWVRHSRKDGDRVQARCSEGTPHSQSYAAMVQGLVGVSSEF